ncbi:MAG: hypothetical protein HY866_10425 [Chloroflexi bacterium]|nr:hypothetical protein [Chloroflexota bacterium]
MSLLKNPRCCLAVLFLILLVVCGCVIGMTLLTLAGEPNAIRAHLEPDRLTAAANEQFTVILNIENVDLDKATINSIGLDSDITDGATLISMTPPYRKLQERDYPIFGKWTQYTLDQILLGGDKLEISLTFQAGQVGVYSGYVTVWVQNDLFGVPFEQARREALRFTVK